MKLQPDDRRGNRSGFWLWKTLLARFYVHTATFHPESSAPPEQLKAESNPAAKGDEEEEV